MILLMRMNEAEIRVPWLQSTALLVRDNYFFEFALLHFDHFIDLMISF